MKKLFFFLGLISASFYLSAQTAIESLSTITTTTNSSYIVVYNESPSKVANKLFAPEFQPWVYSGGYIRPRSPLADRVMLGTTGSYPYLLYVNGTSYFTDQINLTARKKVQIGGSYYTTDASGNAVFYDPVTGSKTLAQLASDAINLDGISPGWILYNAGDTISGNAYFTYVDNTLKLIPQVNDTGFYASASSNNIFLINTTSSANGINMANYGSGSSIIAQNYSTSGRNITSHNISSVEGVYVTTDSTGPAIYAHTYGGVSEGEGEAIYARSSIGGGVAGKFVSDSSGATPVQILNYSAYDALDIRSYATGDLIEATTPTKNVFKVSTDSVYMMYLYGGPDGGRFAVINSTGAIDSGTLENASEQLARFLAPLPFYFWDRKNGELAGFYTKDGKLVKNYGLKDNQTGKSLGLESIELLAGHIERNYRFSWRLWLMIVGLSVFVIYQQRQIIKLKRKCGI